MMLVSVLVVLSLAALSFGNQEFHCSRFEYDLKTLEKMLKVEGKVDKFEEKMRDWEIKIETMINNFNEMDKKRVTATMLSQEEMANRVNSMESKLVDVQRKFAEHLQGNVQSIMSDMNSTITKFLENQAILMKNRGKQVAFTAHGATGKTVNGVLTFSKLLLNDGDSYDIRTGTFTAPVAGIYMFSATFLTPASRSSYTNCWIMKNNNNIALVHSQEGAHDSASHTVLLRLSIGDTVYLVRCGHVKFIYTSSGHSSFMGTLIQAD